MRIIRKFLFAFVFGVLGALVAGTALYVRVQLHKPDLRPWHRAELAAEFDADRDRGMDFESYLALEERLDLQFELQVLGSGDPALEKRWSRYRKLDPSEEPAPLRAADPRWNRTFVLEPNDSYAEPVGGAVLVHGFSDSPYSVRSLALALQDEGYLVVGLRMPGHGTAPSGMLRLTLEDCAAVVRLAVRHVRRRVPIEQPLVLGGYSTGAGLAVEYALSRMDGEQIPSVDRLILLSPALGVTAIAALAPVQDALSSLPGMEKLAWTEVLPEYDPYKYNSFAVNGGTQVRRLALRIEELMSRVQSADGTVAGFPPALMFLSAVDATVSVPAVVDGFLPRLAPNGHELVLFDVDRSADVIELMDNPGTELAARLLAAGDQGYALTVVTNAGDATDEVVARHKPLHSEEAVDEPLGLAWPAGVFSLAHVALPFPPDDPVYGSAPGGDPDARSLGKIEARGERGLLVVPPSSLMRLRYNPFFAYLEQRVRDWVRP